MYFATLKAKLAQLEGYDIKRIENAYIFAENAHRGQKRKTGHEYIIHPLAVAEELLKMGADETTIIAALLHDTIEDTGATKEQLKKDYGNDVALLVDGMTKFSKDAFTDDTDFDAKIETIRKWLDVMRTDLRIAIIKMADRLDNLQSLGIFPNKQKRIRIAQDTLDVYSRVAEWLSMQKVRRQLESDSLQFILSEEECEDLRRKTQKRDQKSEDICKTITEVYRKKADGSQLSFEVAPLALQEAYFSRRFPVTLYCIAENKVECYRALSFFHGAWRRKKNSFEDYINTPRVNGYQALETTIVMENGQEANIRIMTPKMHRYHEYGVTTFCFSNDEAKPELPWIEKLSELLETNKEKSYDFWNGIKSDLLEGFIIVHGPSDSIISLPRKSTYLDAAITALGKKAEYLKRVTAEKGMVTFRQRIGDGEKIGFELSDRPTIGYEWLQEVDNTQSSMIIKQILRERKRNEKIEYGKELLQEELDKYGLGLVEEIDESNTLIRCQDLEIQSLNDLLQKIGEAYIFPSEVTDRIAPHAVIKKNGNGGVMLHFLRCQVIKSLVPAFFTILDSMVEKTSIRQSRNRPDLLNVDVTIKCNRETKNNIIKDIRRAEGMRVVGEGRRMSLYFIFAILTVLWGLDPVAFFLLVQETSLSSFPLTIIRFATVATVLAAIIGVNNLRKSTMLTKHISYRNPRIPLLAMILFIVSYSTYSSLSWTNPSDYTLSLYLPLLFLSGIGLSSSHKNRFLYLILPLILAFIGLLLIYTDNNWSAQGKIWTLVAALSFALYTYLSNRFHQQEKIGIRYIQLYFFISVYGLLLGMMLFFFQDWSKVLFPLEMAAAFLFVVLFVITPYILFQYLIKRVKNIANISYGISLTALITIFSEVVFLGIIPDISKLIAVLLIFVSVGVFSYLNWLEKNIQDI